MWNLNVSSRAAATLDQIVTNNIVEIVQTSPVCVMTVVDWDFDVGLYYLETHVCFYVASTDNQGNRRVLL